LTFVAQVRLPERQSISIAVSSGNFGVGDTPRLIEGQHAAMPDVCLWHLVDIDSDAGHVRFGE
jgi:hypothetical protein